MEIVIGVSTGIALAVVAIVFVLLAVLGLVDLVIMMRFRKSANIDQTAILGNWFNIKWMLVNRREDLAEALPWLGQDLSEVLGVKKDDGVTS